MHKFSTNFKVNLCEPNLLKLEEGKRASKEDILLLPLLEALKYLTGQTQWHPQTAKGKGGFYFHSANFKKAEITA